MHALPSQQQGAENYKIVVKAVQHIIGFGNIKNHIIASTGCGQNAWSHDEINAKKRGERKSCKQRSLARTARSNCVD